MLRRIFITLVAVLLTLQASGAMAQQSASPTLELPPSEPTRHLTAQQEATRELAARSFAGPRTAIVFGALVLVATPVVAVISAFAAHGNAGGSSFGCENWNTGETDEDCERTDDNASKAGKRAFFGAAIGMSALGGGLLALGITRLVKIRRARRVLPLRPDMALGRSGGQLSLTLSF